MMQSLGERINDEEHHAIKERVVSSNRSNLFFIKYGS